MKRRLFDIETDGLLATVSKIHSLVIKDVDTGQIWSCHDHQDLLEGPTIAEGLAILSDSDELIGHNIIDYDIPALQKLFPNWKFKARLIDTLVISRLIWADLKVIDILMSRKGSWIPAQQYGSHSLKAWGYRIGFHKGEFNQGKQTDWSQWSAQMQGYCIQDVELNFRVYQKIIKKNYSQDAIDLELRFREIIALQEQTGFYFDEDGAKTLYAEIAAKKNAFESELVSLFPPRVVTLKTPAHYLCYGLKFNTKKEVDVYRRQNKLPKVPITDGPLKEKLIPFNPSSRDQVAARLIEKYGWKPEEFTDGGGPKIDDDVLGSLPYPECPKLAELFMLIKRMGQISDGKEAWLRWVRDHRIHGGVNTMGTVTGRCSHSHPNLAQVPKHNSKDGGIMPYGLECRSLFQATPGWVLVGCDAEGLELRCLAHYMAKYDGGAYAEAIVNGKKENGTDIHSMNQKAADLANRDMAKTFIYAKIYGAWWQKLGSIVAPLASVEEQIKIGRKLDEQFNRKIPALSQLDAAVKRACGFMSRVGYDKRAKCERVFWSRDPKAKKDYLVGLDGRHLKIRSSHAALNTLLQSAGAVVMKKALCILHDQLLARGFMYDVHFRYVANVHDEFQIECKPENADEIGKLAADSIRLAGEHFKFRCPLAGSYEIGKNWHETH